MRYGMAVVCTLYGVVSITSLSQAQSEQERRLTGTPSAGAAAQPENKTSPVLQLDFRDEGGCPVKVKTAKLTVICYNDGGDVTLPVDTSSITIPLSLGWLQKQFEPAKEAIHLHLYLVADGYAPIRSNVFMWPGVSGYPTESEATGTIDLGRGAKADLTLGKDVHLNVVFRKPGKRVLRFVDEAGQPMPGIKFTYGPFEDERNHCGFVGTIEDYGQCETNLQGLAEVRDADVEYLLTINHVNCSVRSPKPGSFTYPIGDQLNLRLSSEETTITMHRWLRMPLEFHVFRGGKPVDQAGLFVMLPGCHCGGCGGTIATTDKDGRVIVPDFYPENYEYIAFLDSNEKPLWKMTQEEILAKGLPKVVELPEAPPKCTK
jgi:hypothetical protein